MTADAGSRPCKYCGRPICWIAGSRIPHDRMESGAPGVEHTVRRCKRLRRADREAAAVKAQREQAYRRTAGLRPDEPVPAPRYGRGRRRRR